jgi:hypothetical protein
MGFNRRNTFVLFTKWPYRFVTVKAVFKRFSAMYEIFMICMCVGLHMYVCMYVREIICMCVYVDVSVENIKNYFPSSLMQTGSVKRCYISRYCFMCGTIHGTCLRLKLMTCFAYRCTLESVGTFWCVHLTHLHTCVFTGHIQNAWKERQQ